MAVTRSSGRWGLLGAAASVGGRGDLGRGRRGAAEAELGAQLAEAALGLDVGGGLLDLEHPRLDRRLGQLGVGLGLGVAGLDLVLDLGRASGRRRRPSRSAGPSPSSSPPASSPGRAATAASTSRRSSPAGAGCSAAPRPSPGRTPGSTRGPSSSGSRRPSRPGSAGWRSSRRPSCTASPSSASPAFSASAAMISAWRALALSFSSSVILAFSRSSLCFWLAMTLAACSLSRRCWFWASAIACSSCTLGSARSLNEPVSFAVRYFHHLLDELEHGAGAYAAEARRRLSTLAPQRRQLGRLERRQHPDVDGHADDRPDDEPGPRPGHRTSRRSGRSTSHVSSPAMAAGDDHPPQAAHHGAQREARHLVRHDLQRPQRAHDVGDGEGGGQPEDAVGARRGRRPARC